VFSRSEDGRVRMILGAAQDVTVIKESEGDLARMADEKQRQTDELTMFKALVANALDGISVAELGTGKILYANPAYHAMFGISGSAVGLKGNDMFEPAELERMSKAEPMMAAEGRWEGVIRCRRVDGSTLLTHLSCFALKDASGRAVGAGSIMRDVTASVRAEEERTELQARIIRAQQAALRELGTPLIPIADGLLAMPLVGAIDSVRAQQIMEVLLRGIAAERARVVILDITGVLVVDTEVAHALIRTAQAARLLGARVVLTGIGPELAQTLAGMGIELSGIVTRGTFQSGIAYALGGRSGA
jgi:rsbT co-antagonist protein RsbR